MGLTNISKRQEKRQLRVVHRAGRINTPSQARSFTYSCIQIPESTFFWIKYIYRKKGINTCTHPARVKVCGKGQILLSTENKLQKMLLEVWPPKNPRWSKHSAGSDHIHSLQIHPPQAQCWWAESWFLNHEGTGKNSHWISLLTTRKNSTRHSKWLPDRGTVGNDESLTLHTCAAEIN